MSLEPWLQSSYSTAIGWAVVHSIGWGSIFGLAALIARRALRGRAPELRYGVALTFLSLILVTPVVLYLYHAQPGEGAAVSASSEISTPVPGIAGDRSDTDSIVPLLTVPWLIGALLGYAWLLLGWTASLGLRFTSIDLAEPYVDQLTALAAELELRTSVVLRMSDRIATPLLVGIVCPTIALPASLITRLTPEQMEMVLLHELAHLLRRDNLVQLVQRLLTPLSFFQPGAWMVSSWIREEREHCCDAFVLRHRDEPREYANALLLLAESKRLEVRLGAALAGGSLLARVRRILKLEEPTMTLKRPIPLFGLLVCSCILLFSSAADSGWIPSLTLLDPVFQERVARGDDRFVHGRTPCGAEITADCSVCHTSAPKVDEPNCSNCHDSDAESRWSPHGKFPTRQDHLEVCDQECTACHVITKSAGRLEFVAPWGHLDPEGAACVDCHVGPIALRPNPHGGLPGGHLEVPPDSCADCHVPAKPMPKETPRNLPHPRFDQPCTTCHAAPKSTPTEKILLGHQSHRDQPCADCHLPRSSGR